MIGSMKERKMQMRAIGKGSTHMVSGVSSNSKAQTSNFTGTVFNEPSSKVMGIAHGFGTQRPASRDTRGRHPSN